MTYLVQLTLVMLAVRLAQGTEVQGAHEFHPGHPPHHVTRLHRYDHSGIDSMLEAEARWAAELDAIQRRSQPGLAGKVSIGGRVLKDIRRSRGSSLQESLKRGLEQSEE